MIYLLSKLHNLFLLKTFVPFINIYHENDRMVVVFTTTYAISAYHHWCCEFESRSGRGVLVFAGSSGFLYQENWPP